VNLRSQTKLTRRAFLTRGAFGASGLFGGGAMLSLFGERNRPRVYQVPIAIPNLPRELNGLRICQISDLHRGPLITEQYLRAAVERVNGLRPDLTVVTGDFVSDSNRYAESCAAALAPLRAPLGVYGVLGNHDYWTEDVGKVTDALTRTGMQMLTNRSVRLRTRDRDWWLCGADDGWAGKPDLGLALQDVPTGAFKMLLWHEPDLADQAARHGVPLQLSGHSHGGQCLLPGRRPLVGPLHGTKYPVGLRQVENSTTQVYTNVGLGVIWPPIRINCPPEISLITLSAA